jgi:hypothetical protein
MLFSITKIDVFVTKKLCVTKATLLPPRLKNFYLQ